MVDREDAVLFAIPSARRDDVAARRARRTRRHRSAERELPRRARRGRDRRARCRRHEGRARRDARDRGVARREPGAIDLDVGLLFFGREELPITQSALLPLFDRCPATRSIDLAIVMEPTANAIEVGCLGNLNARIEVRGVAAHTARPWLGTQRDPHARSARSRRSRSARRRTSTIDGLVFREVVSVTSIEGGIAGNVVPDRVEATVNFRYAPTRTPAEAEAAPARADLVRRHRAHGDRQRAAGAGRRPQPVGRAAASGGWSGHRTEAGVDPRGGVRDRRTSTPINFGPGDPQYAHRDDERVDIVGARSFLRRAAGFLAAKETEGEG